MLLRWLNSSLLDFPNSLKWRRSSSWDYCFSTWSQYLGTAYFLVRWDSQLHTPMYFFLSNLLFLDICYSTTWKPHVLAQWFRDFSTISYTTYCAQMTTSHFLGMTESPPCCHGLQQVCWNIQSPALYHHYEQSSCIQCLLSNSYTKYCNSCSLLWTQYHQPFHLWDPSSAEVCLLRHPCQSDSGSGYQCIHTALALHLLPHFLLPHCGCYAEDSFCGGQVQSLLHLWIPSNCGHHILWDSNWHVPKTSVKGISGIRQILLNILWCSYSHVYTLRNKDVKGELRKLSKGNEKS